MRQALPRRLTWKLSRITGGSPQLLHKLLQRPTYTCSHSAGELCMHNPTRAPVHSLPLCGSNSSRNLLRNKHGRASLTVDSGPPHHCPVSVPGEARRPAPPCNSRFCVSVVVRDSEQLAQLESLLRQVAALERRQVCGNARGRPVQQSIPPAAQGMMQRRIRTTSARAESLDPNAHAQTCDLALLTVRECAHRQTSWLDSHWTNWFTR